MPRHLTARLAWHDNGWNGNVCSSPSSNSYCVGTRSLLSERLRRDRDAVREDGIHDQAADIQLPAYAPPCYWGINAFGPEPRRVLHRHAFADLRDTHFIEDLLPPYSLITWPFRISFNLDEETRNRYGKYHPRLEDRINRFFAAHRDNQSQQRYAIVGCGLLKEKGKPHSVHVQRDRTRAISLRKRDATLPGCELGADTNPRSGERCSSSISTIRSPCAQTTR